jgi:cephalosporin hydroxylase
MISEIVRWLEPYPPLYRTARAVYRFGRDLSIRYQRRQDRRIARAFHRLFYHGPVGEDGIWFTVGWLGVPVQKCPLDLCILQEILVETRPELIIECGVKYGGSTLYLASICDLTSCGQILACDATLANLAAAARRHPRIEFIEAGSTSAEFLALAASRAAGRRTMVVLDSDHRRDHVLEELRKLGPLVSPGCYLVCEDTNINGHPVYRDFGPGPFEALEIYLRESGKLWTIDRTRERFLVTFNPGGYLRRNLHDGTVSTP